MFRCNCVWKSIPESQRTRNKQNCVCSWIVNSLNRNGVIGIQPTLPMSCRTRGVGRAQHRLYLMGRRLAFHDLQALGLVGILSRSRINEHRADQKKRSEQFHESNARVGIPGVFFRGSFMWFMCSLRSRRRGIRLHACSPPRLAATQLVPRLRDCHLIAPAGLSPALTPASRAHPMLRPDAMGAKASARRVNAALDFAGGGALFHSQRP